MGFGPAGNGGAAVLRPADAVSYERHERRRDHELWGGTGNYDAQRFGADYSRMLREIGTYGDDGLELMIKNGWLEKLPGAVDRKVLIKQ
jgi:hypothetical protein